MCAAVRYYTRDGVGPFPIDELSHVGQLSKAALRWEAMLHAPLNLCAVVARRCDDHCGVHETLATCMQVHDAVFAYSGP